MHLATLHAYLGANRRSSGPLVAFAVQDAAERMNDIRDRLKHGAQRCGMVVGYLQLDVVGGQVIGQFATPTPRSGAALIEVLVGALAAHTDPDDASDAFEAALPALRQRCRAEALPLVGLQLQAEAAARKVPTMPLDNGDLLVGQGCRSVRLNRLALGAPEGGVSVGPPPGARPPAAEALEWAALGSIPLLLVVGNAQTAVVTAAQAILAARGLRIGSACNANNATLGALLSNQTIDLALVGLDAAALWQEGLALQGCTAAALVDLPPPPPTIEPCTWIEALGVPALLATRGTWLADEPALHTIVAPLLHRPPFVGNDPQLAGEWLAKIV